MFILLCNNLCCDDVLEKLKGTEGNGRILNCYEIEDDLKVWNSELIPECNTICRDRDNEALLNCPRSSTSAILPKVTHGRTAVKKAAKIHHQQD